MQEQRLLDRQSLEASPVVANCAMNRERDLTGTNGYGIELGVEPLEWLRQRLSRQRVVRWLDLCCGSGKALIQAAAGCESATDAVLRNGAVQITGVDLVGMFLPNHSASLRLIVSSVFDFTPVDRFDLITCVHGLHYLGDKLHAIALASSWLVPDGLLIASLDVKNMRLGESQRGDQIIARSLREAGFQYDARRHRLQRIGHANWEPPFHYVGADDTVGPNYTRQPAVESVYSKLRPA
ncbi:MAG: methyltransferase domain-containing protein [Pirellulaceae bacterium]